MGGCILPGGLVAVISAGRVDFSIFVRKLWDEYSLLTMGRSAVVSQLLTPFRLRQVA